MPDPIRALILSCTTLLATGLLPAQGQPGTDQPTRPKPNPIQTQDQRPHFIVRRYPQDQNEAIAVVGGKTLTLGQLIEHIDARHYQGFKKLVAEEPTFSRMLQSDLIAPWVRQYADLEALRQSLGDTYVDPVELEKKQSASLKASFENYLTKLAENRRLRGVTTPLSQRRVDSELRRFQLKRGLGAEVQGMLDLLEPDTFSKKQLRDFFNDNARFFGGQVTIQHLLIQHRDGGTGILLDDEGRARANARVAEVQARLRPDGSNFEELVRLFSDDTRTAKDGGTLHGVHRFDDRLPAVICRTAWALRDGEVTTDVVESQYGWHFIRRVSFAQQVFALWHEDAMPGIRVTMQRWAQERRLFGAREQVGVRLLL